MFQRALVVGIAAVTLAGGGHPAGGTTEPPSADPVLDTFTVQHAENFTRC